MKIKKAFILFYILLSLSIYSQAQGMTSKHVLNNLTPFWLFIENLRNELQVSENQKFSSELEQSYSFIGLKLIDEKGQTTLQIRFQLKPANTLSLYEFYCSNKSIALSIELQAQKIAGNFYWDTTPINKLDLTNKVTLFLEIADRIASVGNDIDASPSDYGKLILTAKFIKLEQINHRNAKSINHKDNYFLRDLYFIIPLNDEDTIKDSLKIGYNIGGMTVCLNDRSTKSNQKTGDEIMTKLNEEIKNFK